MKEITPKQVNDLLNAIESLMIKRDKESWFMGPIERGSMRIVFIHALSAIMPDHIDAIREHMEMLF